MRLNKNQWLKLITSPIVGFDEQGEGAGQGTGEGSQGEGQGAAEGQGEGNSAPLKTYTEEEVAGLKSALQKERNERKTEAAELKAFRQAQQAKDDSEKTEVQRLTDGNASLATKLERLSQGFRDRAVEAAVLKAAQDAKFRDPSDAMRFDIVGNLPVTQDEDDPSQVTVDTEELTRRIKKLAKDKPHYLAVEAPAPRAGRTGSTFSGTTNGAKQQSGISDDLRAKYPALRGL